MALAQKEEIEDEEVEGGRGKWGSCVDRLGREGVRRTAAGGWGVGGSVGSGEGAVGREEFEGFEEAGRTCWREMERLRVTWEDCLGGW